MEKRELEELLAKVASGDMTPEKAALAIDVAPVTELGYAQVDNQRGVRQGVSEVIYGEGKTADQIAGIIASMLDAGQTRVLITRLDADKALEVQTLLSDGLVSAAANDVQGAAPTGSASGGSAGRPAGTEIGAEAEASDTAVSELPIFTYYDLPRIGIVGEMPEPDGIGSVVVVTGGTSDIPVAEEAALTAEILGNKVERLYDVGVSGIHRLLSHVEDISQAKVIVAVAGMEGALASVVAGLVSCPVIAVPTSVGYGASFGGVSALLSMLNSCASGVSVVNIDNGFGAGYQANLINHVK